MNQSVFYYDLADESGGSRRFWMYEAPLSRTFSKAIPARAADLLDVVGTIYAADRQSKRCFQGVATGQRRINIRLAVREPEPWSSPELISKLRELLSWISGDVWTIEFAKRKGVYDLNKSEGFLFNLPLRPPVTVSLFSGGLDSLAGLARRAQSSPGGSRILVSTHTHHRLAYQQRTQVQRIRAACGREFPVVEGDVWHIAVPFGIDSSGRNQEEKGQRTRALVFLALGAVTTLQAQTDTLSIFENGIGALNLPLNATQLGTDNYRGVHPRTLSMAQGLFESVLGQLVQIKSPFLFTTKAEMCRSLLPAGLADVARETVSCDGYPQRARNQPQCGCCTSCILRRQALFCSGLADHDPSSAYRHNIFEHPSALSLDQIHGLAAMTDQVNRFASCLSSEQPWKQLTAAYPELARIEAENVADQIVASDDTASSLVGLFRAYVKEWEAFLAATEFAV